MTKVNTSLGAIDAADLGATLMHEHLVLGYPGYDADALCTPYNKEELVKTCAGALAEAKKYGLKTVVDATPNDLGRHVELDKAVSDKTGINIICATGMYMEAEGQPAYLKFRGQLLDIQAELYDTFMQEITVGIGKSGVKAGVIKVATGHGCISPYEEKVLKAAAKAQKETGMPIITHTQSGTMGVEQATLLTGEGADPKKIMIGHMCCSSNLEYHLAVLGKGVSIGLDRFGIEFLYPDNLRKATLVGLLAIGYADYIMLSHDHIASWLGRPFELPDFVQALLANWSYSHIFKNIIPEIKKTGVTEEQVNKMLVENPKRLFGG
ncbi:MAG: phosphotriesterase [Chloroflexi bacterium]|nr:phosphotriesterase [Chloroflexota bacterium]MBM3165896.1 phosphotriesterase [Chloroflexota bacterium]MBM3172513.1 phosphotriesterase [Chloroflexota bacterium]MBM4450362.1 phosphotriesterase [Chloroflexota bacterium]